MKLLMIVLLSLTLYAADKSYKYGDLEERNDGLLVETTTQAPANGIGNFYYESGKLRGETPFREGIREGIAKTYYESGKLQSETTFKNDRVEDITKFYYESGKIQSETPFKNTKAQGIAKFYDESGKLKHEIEFEESKVIKAFAYEKKGNKTQLSNTQIQDMGF